jgi:uncharacterized phiE125 gp8 family phage protein
MTLTLTSPAEELALDWATEVQGHLRLTEDTERARIESILIPAAMALAESETDRQIITATWTLYMDDFPASGTIIELPKPPLQSVTHVKYYDTAGVQQTWTESGNYTVVAPSGPYAEKGYIAPEYGITYPSTQAIKNAVEVQFLAGYGDSYKNVPPLIRAAMLLIVGEQFERRENAIAGTIISQIPLSAQRLLWPFRVF